MKATQITELKIENELYKRELIRLRTLLDVEMDKTYKMNPPKY